jgi:serine/threonine protein kinase
MYSLGIMLVQFITGTLPFRIEEKNPVEEIISCSYLDNVKQILKLKSKRLERLIYACINPDTKMRPKSYDSFLNELSRC